MYDIRDWPELQRQHLAFWECGETDRPLVGVMRDALLDVSLVARTLGQGEIEPADVDPGAALSEFDRFAVARRRIGDDVLAIGEPIVGIPWLEAMCGCRIISAADGNSVWAERPAEGAGIIPAPDALADNPWFQKLLENVRATVEHAAGRYAVAISHLRGPADLLAALLGTDDLFIAFYDDPDRVRRLAGQIAGLWTAVARAQADLIPSFRGGYGLRQFGLWAPERGAWIQDDTSGMISLKQYRALFGDAMRQMSIFPCSELHLHLPSLHLAEELSEIAGICAVNVYTDSLPHALQDALPTLQRLQARNAPLILAKDVYEGFTLAEYDEILDGLSPRGLLVQLKAEGIEEGREVMARVREMGARCV